LFFESLRKEFQKGNAEEYLRFLEIQEIEKKLKGGETDD